MVGAGGAGDANALVVLVALVVRCWCFDGAGTTSDAVGAADAGVPSMLVVLVAPRVLVVLGAGFCWFRRLCLCWQQRQLLRGGGGGGDDSGAIEATAVVGAGGVDVGGDGNAFAVFVVVSWYVLQTTSTSPVSTSTPSSSEQQ